MTFDVFWSLGETKSVQIEWVKIFDIQKWKFEARLAAGIVNHMLFITNQRNETILEICLHLNLSNCLNKIYLIARKNIAVLHLIDSSVVIYILYKEYYT